MAVVVKPQDMADLLAEIAAELRPGQLVVSLAAGITTGFIESRIPDGVAVVRVMPNTPALVDEGMAAISRGSHCDEAHLDEAESLMASTGRVIRVPERQQDAVTAISGSGPAYLFFVVEAMIEAGVHLGLPRTTSTELVVQTVVGSAKLLRETGEHPTVLREQVTSPGGTTAAAVRELEDHKVRAAFLTAMEAARDRSRSLAEGAMMSRYRPCTVFDRALVEYDFGATHPMNPIRVELTMGLAERAGRSSVPGACRWWPRPIAPEDLLLTVHDEALIEAVQRIGADPTKLDLPRGLGTEDNPTFEGMHHASAHIVGATVEAARRVWTGEVLHAASITGGLHHAMPDRASGFCVYNDVAVAIRWLLDNGAQKVAYVDVDVHHGDGVERVFYDDPRVLTISLHETGQMLFPGHRVPRRRRRARGGGVGGQRRAAPRAPPTPAGCGPSTRSCHRWCASSPPTSSSPSTAATPTPRTRWRT